MVINYIIGLARGGEKMTIPLLLLLVRVGLVLVTNKKATKRTIILKVAAEILKFILNQYF